MMSSILHESLDNLTASLHHRAVALIGDDATYKDACAWVLQKLQAKETHPDMLCLAAKTQENISVEDVRQIIQRLHIYPFSGSYYVIIPQAHALSKHCMNALLKVLEEPVRTWFFLITPHKHMLAATIRSRCVVLEALSSSAIDMQLYDDLWVLIKEPRPLTMSVRWHNKTASATEWLKMLWSAVAFFITSAEYLQKNDPQHMKRILSFMDDILFVLKKQAHVLQHKRCVERFLLAWVLLHHDV